MVTRLRLLLKTESIDDVQGGFNGYSGTLNYDAAVLSRGSTATSVPGWNFVFNPAANTFLGSDPTGMDFKTIDLDVFEIQFQVLDDAPLGTTKVKLTKLVLSDSSYRNVNLSDAVIDLTIEDVGGVVEPPKSSNSKLSELTINGQTLTPGFNPNTTDYTLTVGSNVGSIMIDGKAEDGNATIVSGKGNHSLETGLNTIQVLVKAEDGSTKTYTIKVTKEAPVLPDPNDNTPPPSGGKPDPNDTTPPPSGGKPDPNDNTPPPSGGKPDPNDNTPPPSGGKPDPNDTTPPPSGGKPDPNDNTPPPSGGKPEPNDTTPPPSGGTPNDQNIGNNPSGGLGNIVNSNESSNNFVINIQGMGTLDKEFKKDVYHYHTVVGKQVTELDPLVVLEDLASKFELIGGKDLKLGLNKVTLRVTASNGSMVEYIFDVERSEVENNSLLSALTVGGYPINPGFREDVNYYSLTVPAEVETLGVTATPKFGGASVNVIGHDKLNYGVNFVKVAVTGGNFMNTYMVEVIRQSVPAKSNVLPWVLVGVSGGLIAILLITFYYNRKIDRMFDNRNTRVPERDYYVAQPPVREERPDPYYFATRPYYREDMYEQPRPSSPPPQNNDLDSLLNQPDVQGLTKEYFFYKDVQENGQKVRKKFKIIESSEKGK